MTKALTITGLLLGCLTSYSQVIAIPDANFKAKLLQSTSIVSVAKDYYGNAIKVDTNDNGEIEVSEVSSIYLLSVGNANISDLTGIQYFTGLGHLICQYNNLTTLDVSGMQNLSNLNCFENELTQLIADNTNIITLNCGSNNLTTLDFASLDSVVNLSFYDNDFTSLVLTADLLPNVSSLNCGSNQISTLLINNQSLESLHCSGNLLTELDLSNMDISYLSCGFNQLTELNFSTNPINYLSFSYNNLTTLDVSMLNSLDNLYCGNNPGLTSINLKNTSIEGLVNINSLPSLNYICADEQQIADLQEQVDSYNYVGVVIDSQCDLGIPNAGEDKLVVYPNPVSHVLYMSDEISQQPKSIQIFNLLGQQLIAISDARNVLQIDVSTLETGTYFLIVKYGNEHSTTKFIKL